MSKGWVKYAFILAMTAGVPAQGQEPLVPVRTNPILYDYFRQQLYESHLHESERGRYLELDIHALNSHARNLAKDFSSQATEKLGALRQGFEQIEHARSEALSGPVTVGTEVKAAWSASLKHVSDEASALHKMLSFVIGGFGPKGPSAPTIDPRGLDLRGADPAFENETRVMGDQILKLDQSIRGFLSGESFTISVEDLRDKDMLALLSQVRIEAAEMRKELETQTP